MPKDSPEEMLRENLELTRENNKLLKKIRRASIFGGLLKIVWWALIFGVPVYLYFTFAEPYIEQAQTTYESAREDVSGITETFDQIRSFLRGQNIPVQ